MKITVESPFPAWAWPLSWQWMQGFRARIMDDFAAQTQAAYVAQMLAQRSMKTWGVYRDGELGGLIAAEPDSPYRVTAHCLFSRAFWGRETTQPALRAVAGQLFAAGVGKLMMFPFADNHQVRASNRELGAVDEGLLRAHTLRGGKPADVVALAVHKEAFHVATHQQDHDHQHADLHRGPEPDADERVGHDQPATSEPGRGLRSGEECGA